MKKRLSIRFILPIILIICWGASGSAEQRTNLIGQPYDSWEPVKDSKSDSRLTLVCQRENLLKEGRLHDDLYVLHQSNREHGNGEQLIYKAGLEDLYDLDFSAKQISESRDGISVEDSFEDTSVAIRLHQILNDKADPPVPVKAQINPTGQMKVFLKDDEKDDRFIIRTFAPEISHLRDKMRKKTYYRCKIFVLPELSRLQP